MDFFLDLAVKETDPDVRQTLLYQAQKVGIHDAIKSCKSCHLHKSCRQRVPFHGQRGSFVILGEAPGADEDRLGVPFVGVSGKLLREELNYCKVDPAIMNTVCCRPPGNRTPTEKEIDACSHNFNEQIQHLNPWLILCLGSTALKKLRPELGVTKHRGLFFDIPDYPGVWGFSTYHPAYVLRNRTELPNWRKDIRTAAAAVKMRNYFGAEIIDSDMAMMKGDFPDVRTLETPEELRKDFERVQEALFAIEDMAVSGLDQAVPE